MFSWSLSLCEKCPCLEFFWFVFFRIWFEYAVRIQSECGKIRTRKTPNTENFHVVYFGLLFFKQTKVNISRTDINQGQNQKFGKRGNTGLIDRLNALYLRIIVLVSTEIVLVVHRKVGVCISFRVNFPLRWNSVYILFISS